MRPLLVCCLLGALALPLGASVGASSLPACAATAPNNHAAPSSFAPHRGAKRRTYGAPIQRPILKRVPRKKAHTPH